MKIKKIFFFLLIAISLTGFVFFGRLLFPRRITLEKPPIEPPVIQTEKVTRGGTFYFSPNSGSFKINQPFKVNIMINTNGRSLTGADSVVKYNPQLGEVVGDPIPGNIFPSYPFLAVKKGKGEINITGTITDPNQPVFKGRGLFATIVIKPLVKGKFSLTFDHIPGKTSDSNLAEKDSGLDVLTKVINANFSITP